MFRKKIVRLSYQSFKDAGGLESFPDLQIIGPVFADSSVTGSRERTVKSANENLIEKAREEEMTHIFGITYKWSKDRSKHANYGTYHDCFAMGTGYKHKNKK